MKGGRPRGAKSLIAHAMVQRVCLKHFKKHVAVLEGIIANSDRHQARISAITVLWERGLGKVPQAHTGEGGGPVVLQLITGVTRPDDWGQDWEEPKAIEAPPPK